MNLRQLFKPTEAEIAAGVEADLAVERKKLEQPKQFIQVLTNLYPHDADYWDAGVYTWARTGQGELEIRLAGRQDPICAYGPAGWLRVRRTSVKPSDIEDFRLDATTT